MNPWNNTHRLCFLVFSLLAGCALPPEADLWVPSDDPGDYEIDSSTSYSVEAGQPIWVVPSEGLPAEVEPMAANNNVDIAFHRGRLYLAWRSAPSHFASKAVKIYIVSCADWGGLVSGRDATPTWERAPDRSPHLSAGQLHLAPLRAGDQLARRSDLGQGNPDLPADPDLSPRPLIS
jgi:hypothetical protein